MQGVVLVYAGYMYDCQGACCIFSEIPTLHCAVIYVDATHISNTVHGGGEAAWNECNVISYEILCRNVQCCVSALCTVRAVWMVPSDALWRLFCRSLATLLSTHTPSDRLVRGVCSATVWQPVVASPSWPQGTRLTQGSVLPASQKRPDKTKCLCDCATTSRHCILVVVVLAVPCELCYDMWGTSATTFAHGGPCVE